MSLRKSYKNFSNSVYGKALESLRRRQDVRIVTNRMQAKRLIARPTFDWFRIVSENLTIVKMKKIQVYWNRPTYLGMCILDLYKLHMYKFHYDHIQHLYGYRAKLLFTDTDSLTNCLPTTRTPTCPNICHCRIRQTIPRGIVCDVQAMPKC